MQSKMLVFLTTASEEKVKMYTFALWRSDDVDKGLNCCVVGVLNELVPRNVHMSKLYNLYISHPLC